MANVETKAPPTITVSDGTVIYYKGWENSVATRSFPKPVVRIAREGAHR